LGLKPTRIIKAAGHNAYDIRRCGRLTEQPGATIRAETTADNAAAISDDFVVFNLAADANRVDRDKNRRGKCAAGRPLAIAAVAIPHSNWMASSLLSVYRGVIESPLALLFFINGLPSSMALFVVCVELFLLIRFF
jgi:hypothetical protein